ncbi:MAG: 50S ribosomal protein L7/L12 [Microgenomates group bacterium GW2011_GWC1_37_8]|uniref:50S ribosomal protein L7/L12 n=1 Tax=Candidatus Woesebacteria bacterium GW2011_GWB1_38_8 TaxID=1618570 RepID=A0A0G0L2W4_9BACT|nr:MAG: 50S ribosomal protein L7/L12 [Microgenomates group bacterium GW2011_GWC1_37_8]KKQ85352.1 MAG: 50S ribosomal protein L7/L12 [Candidatus Woesebacteria bacterium GW2011_GWB1_38_8]
MTDKKEEVKAPKESKTSKVVEKLVEEVAKLSVMELSELVNALQDKLGVSAAAPMMAAPVQAAEASTAEGAHAGTGGGGGAATQTVIMTNSGANKIAVIKALREINQNLSLMDAKGMTEQVPAEILKDAKADDAKSAVEKLKTAGASVESK